MAGELLRILVNHPEVWVDFISAPGKEGLPVSEIHHGLVNKENIKFNGPLPLNPSCNVIFICGNSMTSAEFNALKISNPDLKLIQVDRIPNLDSQDDIVFGIPEINRKQLVRGALYSFIPTPVAVGALVALYPLALHMLLNDSLRISARLPGDILELNRLRAPKEIKDALAMAQLSFSGDVDIDITEGSDSRRMDMEIEMNCNISVSQLLEIYEIYNDHNFAYVVSGDIHPKETPGTPRCVFSVSVTPENVLKIKISLDPRLRGGASEAVHNMNLLFGLHETTGLELKANGY